MLAFLLEKLHVLQSKDASILGLARPTSQDITLPQMASTPSYTPGVATSMNPITAALDPTGAEAPAKMPITPPPKTIMPFWGGYPAGVVLHRKHAGAGAECTVSAGTQTADPELESADRLLDKVMQDVRPWGVRARHHPAAAKSPGGRKPPPATPAGPAQCAAASSRAAGAAGLRGCAVATPQGRVPKYVRTPAPEACGGAAAGVEGVAERGLPALPEGGVGGARARHGSEERAGGTGGSSARHSGRASSLSSHFVAVTPPPPSLQSDDRSGRSILNSVGRP